MRVTVFSTLSSHPDHIIVNVEADYTVNALIALYCTEKGIPQRKHYVIRDVHQTVLPIHNKLQTVQIEEDDVVYLGMKGLKSLDLHICSYHQTHRNVCPKEKLKKIIICLAFGLYLQKKCFYIPFSYFHHFFRRWG